MWIVLGFNRCKTYIQCEGNLLGTVPGGVFHNVFLPTPGSMDDSPKCRALLVLQRKHQFLKLRPQFFTKQYNTTWYFVNG